ncbi:hypothetical protein, partial [Klebsiella pneumoniae]|uniref:hypothetical protein n=1 Tax=Klebsiella pneumoniae TaxID=573 RepID=UPI0019195234
ELSKLLLSMNSYYSNKIEGEHTRPLDITRALGHDFSSDQNKARLQRLALAHIKSEAWIQEQSWDTKALYSRSALENIHGHLFGQLAASDRMVRMHAPDGSVKEEVEVAAGVMRTREVSVKHHIAPGSGSLDPM